MSLDAYALEIVGVTNRDADPDAGRSAPHAHGGDGTGDPEGHAGILDGRSERSDGMRRIDSGDGIHIGRTGEGHADVLDGAHGRLR